MMDSLIHLERLKKEAEEHYNNLKLRKSETFEIIEELFQEYPDDIPKRKKEYIDIIKEMKNTISEIKEELKKYYN